MNIPPAPTPPPLPPPKQRLGTWERGMSIVWLGVIAGALFMLLRGLSCSVAYHGGL